MRNFDFWRRRRAANVQAAGVNGGANVEQLRASAAEEMGEPVIEEGKVNVYNLIIVDESGSMGSLREATLGGINETINTIRGAQEEFAQTQNHYLTLVTFDSGFRRPWVRTILNKVPIASVSGFEDYDPNGSTPLYDAMGQSLTELERFVKKDPTASVVVTVLTDGYENDSRKWNAGSIRQLIERLKEKGWSFAYMGSAHDVEQVTISLSIDNVMEFAHDEAGAERTWARERGARRSYYRKLDAFQMACDASMLSDEELAEQRRGMASDYYHPRVTPKDVSYLKDDEVFVFGSNAYGNHNGGAAALAVRKFGAVMGQAEGPQGSSYAIPTVGNVRQLESAVGNFIHYAEEHPEKRFLVTAVGCGHAGYTPDVIAPMFRECVELENVMLPGSFWDALGLKMYKQHNV